ncbi:glycosyltransferase [Agaribacterium sp. ZY112]|uniref:glycosyltransferase n=1 Tax=Agaribacterium sp. ZY112 TaxID=3233574 RepID=UPI0035265962
MSLITINPMKSTSLGGVETLIRELQAVYAGSGPITELYEKPSEKDEFNERKGVEYRCFGISFLGLAILSKILTKFRQILFLSRSCSSGHDATVVLFHPNDLLYMPARVRKEARVILVQTNRLDVFFGGRLEHFVLRRYARFVDVISVYTDQDEKRLAEEYQGAFSRTVVIPRGCKIDTAEVAPTHSKKLVAIARIDEEQKNFTAMVSIMRNLPSDFSLDIYGGGSASEVAALNKLVEPFDKVRYMGVTVDVQETLSNYAVFIMTSHYEGFGQTLIEARSQGLPIVAFDTFDALSWIVDDGKSGFVVPAYDEALFVKKLELLCGSKELYASFAEQSLLKASETDRAVVRSKWFKELIH